MFTKQGNIDLICFTAVIILLSIGIVMVFSTSSVMGVNDFRDPYHYVKRQLIWAVVGIALLAFTAKLDYHIYKPFALPALLLAIVLLVLVLIIGKDMAFLTSSRLRLLNLLWLTSLLYILLINATNYGIFGQV